MPDPDKRKMRELKRADQEARQQAPPAAVEARTWPRTPRVRPRPKKIWGSTAPTGSTGSTTTALGRRKTIHQNHTKATHSTTKRKAEFPLRVGSVWPHSSTFSGTRASPASARPQLPVGIGVGIGSASRFRSFRGRRAVTFGPAACAVVIATSWQTGRCVNRGCDCQRDRRRSRFGLRKSIRGEWDRRTLNPQQLIACIDYARRMAGSQTGSLRRVTLADGFQPRDDPAVK